jgi:hypothetical protein
LPNVNLYKGDVTKMIDYGQDVIYIDAPWGGVDYKDAQNISLYLSGIEIAEFYSKFLNYSSLFIFKVPLNYKISNFENVGISLKTVFDMNIKKQEFMLGNKARYLFLIINGNPTEKTVGNVTDMSVGGTSGIKFLNPYLEDLYNKLSIKNQTKIKQLNDNDKINEALTLIFNEMPKIGGNLNSTIENKSELTENFDMLPKNLQLNALGGAYEQMAQDFKQAGNELAEELTVIKPDDNPVPEEFKIKNVDKKLDESGEKSDESDTKKISFS